MYCFKFLIISLLFFLNACSQNFQRSGLSEKTLKEIEIEIGKTTKEQLNKKYGPPIFENVFNKNVVYYISHSTSYKTFEKQKTDKLLVYEIILDDENIVQKYKQYTEKESVNLEISEAEDKSNIDFTNLFKDIINAMRKKNIED